MREEINKLFNQLRETNDSMNKTQESLAQQVAEQTAELREQNKFLEALNDLSLSLHKQQTTSELTDSVVKQACKMTGTETGFIYASWKDVAPGYTVSAIGALDNRGAHVLPEEKSLYGIITKTGKSINVDNYSAWENRRNVLENTPIYAMMGAPLMRDGKVMGALGVGHTKPHPKFNAADVARLERFANLAAIACENARLEEAVRLELEERRKAEKQLQRERDFAVQISETMGQGLTVGSLSGTIKYINPTMAEKLGYTVEELENRPIHAMYATEDHAKYEERRKNLVANKGILNEERLLLHRNGAKIPFLITQTVRPVIGFAADGTAEDSVFCVATDLTPVKETEHALRVARDSALEALELRSQFIATMSHEIRTPLNAILGMAEMLLDDSLDQKHLEYIEIIQSSGQALMDLVQDILDFAKLEAGNIDMEMEKIELAPFMENIFRMFLLKAQAKQINLNYDIAQDTPSHFYGYTRQLRQTLINLISNAIKFTDTGSIQMRVSKGSDGKDTPAEMLFEVEDTGVGISASAKPRIFMPFVQGDNANSRRFGGAGLGLSICKSLVDLMGGEMGFESLENQGSVFWFTLPSYPTLNKLNMPA